MTYKGWQHRKGTNYISITLKLLIISYRGLKATIELSPGKLLILSQVDAQAKSQTFLLLRIYL